MNWFKKVKDDSGAVTLQGLITLIIVVLIVWSVISVIPVIQVPNDLEGSVGELCKDWLRQRVPERKPSIKAYTQKIKDKIAEVLTEHSYNTEDLDIDFVNLQNVKVRLPYVIKISIIGINFDTEKMLDINQTSVTF